MSSCLPWVVRKHTVTSIHTVSYKITTSFYLSSLSLSGLHYCPAPQLPHHTILTPPPTRPHSPPSFGWGRIHFRGSALYESNPGMRVIRDWWVRFSPTQIQFSQCSTSFSAIPLWDKTRSFWDINHTLSHELGSEWVSKRAKKWAQQSAQAKRAGQSKRTSEQCDQTSRQTSSLDSWLFWPTVG